MSTESDIKTVERLIYAREAVLCEAINHRVYAECHEDGAPCPAVTKVVSAWERVKAAALREKP